MDGFLIIWWFVCSYRGVLIMYIRHKFSLNIHRRYNSFRTSLRHFIGLLIFFVFLSVLASADNNVVITDNWISVVQTAKMWFSVLDALQRLLQFVLWMNYVSNVVISADLNNSIRFCACAALAATNPFC